MNQNQTLLMWLEGPLQSWGCDSRYGRRESLSFPTKSGVEGLICAALGAKGPQDELLQILASYPMKVIAYQVPGQPQEFMRDFQTVGNGYDSKDPFELLFIPKTSEGKNAVGGGSKITYRYYLQGMAFAVLLELPMDLSEIVSQALIEPVYFLSLGRKSCAPSDWIYQGTFSTRGEAEITAEQVAARKHLSRCFSVIEGQYPEDGEVLVLNDVASRFGKQKQYVQRFVTIVASSDEEPATD